MVGLDHRKEFRTKEAVATEKAKLVAAVQKGGSTVLNRDDPLVLSMADQTRERIVTFGRSAGADVRVLSAEARFPDRLTVELERDGQRVRIPTRFVAEHFWVSVAAAFCVARELGVPTEVIVRQCAGFDPLPARCEVIETGDGPVFILDTFKAPWETLSLAFRIVKMAQEVPRKRIVLGGISDYAGSSRTKYRQAYQEARALCDQVIFVGDHALRSRASDADRRSGRIVEIESVRELDAYIRRTAVPGELILLKSSKPIHLDRVALSWKYNVQCWEQKCGVKSSCMNCGLYDYPFEKHRGHQGRFENQQQG
jgi:UDP-N-acetylmuramoyl-tripeptide--D-alanyl-D-alanine ligase